MKEFVLSGTLGFGILMAWGLISGLQAHDPVAAAVYVLVIVAAYAGGCWRMDSMR